MMSMTTSDVVQGSVPVQSVGTDSVCVLCHPKTIRKITITTEIYNNKCYMNKIVINMTMKKKNLHIKKKIDITCSLKNSSVGR